MRLGNSVWAVGLFLLLLSPSCKRDSKPIPVPADLQLKVMLESGTTRLITSGMLAGVAPDFTDEAQRGWKLERLIGADYGSPTLIDVEHGEGRLSKLRLEKESVVLLSFDKRGRAVLSVVKASDPFPAFHGRGGNRGRSGDSDNRIRDVKAVQLSSHAPADWEELQLEVIFNGEKKSWSGTDLGAPDVQLPGEDGTESRRAWSLRTLLQRRLPGAELQEVQGEGVAVVSPDDWKNLAKTPVLKLNRRGAMKFEWVDTAKQTPHGNSLRNVRAIKVAAP